MQCLSFGQSNLVYLSDFHFSFTPICDILYDTADNHKVPNKLTQDSPLCGRPFSFIYN